MVFIHKIKYQQFSQGFTENKKSEAPEGCFTYV